MLRVDGLLTKSGVFEYLNPDGTIRREYRPPEEVFRDDSMQTFAMCPFTDGHPSEVVTSKNARQFAVGSLSENVRRDGEHLAATIAVFDGDVIQKMESGNIQLSCGYEVDLDITPGTTPDGERYDAIQRNIRGNHVALVTHARAGESARVRMDAAMQQPSKEIRMPNATEKEMKEAMEAALVQSNSSRLRADKAEADLLDAQKRADKAEGELESVRVKLTTLEKLREDEQPQEKQAVINGLQSQLAALNKARNDELVAAPLKLREAVKARVALESSAAMVLTGQRLDDLDDRQIMTAVVQKLHGVTIDDKRSEDYVRARFDAAVEGFQSGAKAIDFVRELNHEKRQDEAPRKSPRELMVERNTSAWKTPVEGAAK